MISIKDAQLERIASDAGAWRVNVLVYDAVRARMMEHLQTKTVRLAVDRMAEQKRTTVQADDARHAVARHPWAGRRLKHAYFAALPFKRLIIEVSQDMMNDVQFAADALDIIRQDVEHFVHALFKDANVAARADGRITVLIKDFS